MIPASMRSRSEAFSQATLKRILADAGYRGHNAPGVYKLRVFTAGQKRRVTPAIKRQMKRRSAVEPVIGHMKNGHRMDRNRLAHAQGDAINPILAAAGYTTSASSSSGSGFFLLCSGYGRHRIIRHNQLKSQLDAYSSQPTSYLGSAGLVR